MAITRETLEELKSQLPGLINLIDDGKTIDDRMEGHFRNILLHAIYNEVDSVEMLALIMEGPENEWLAAAYNREIEAIQADGHTMTAQEEDALNALYKWANDTKTHGAGDWKRSNLPNSWRSTLSVINRALKNGVALSYTIWECTDPQHGAKYQKDTGVDPKCPDCVALHELVPKTKNEISAHTSKAIRNNSTSPEDDTDVDDHSGADRENPEVVSAIDQFTNHLMIAKEILETRLTSEQEQSIARTVFKKMFGIDLTPFNGATEETSILENAA